MKKILLTAVFLLLGIFAVSAQESITIVNNTGYIIYGMYISPSEDDNWGLEVLDDHILENGQSFSYRLVHPLNRVNTYDILLIDEDGDYYVKWEVRVRNNARIVFTFDDIDIEFY